MENKIEVFGKPSPKIEDVRLFLDYLTKERADFAQSSLRLNIKRNKDGGIEAVSILNTMENLDLILRYDPEYGGKVQENEMGGAVYYNGKEDAHLETKIQKAISRDYHVEFAIDGIARNINDIAADYKFHPVRDFLHALEPWDGVDYFPKLAEMMNLEPNELNIIFLTRFWIQMVARVEQPGCRAEACLVLVGMAGGETKSSFARAIAYDDHENKNWFGQQNLDFKFGYKDTLASMYLKWLVEIGEISQYMGNQHDNDKLKDFVTCKEDNMRPAYGRRVITTRRSFCLIGTTNHLAFLREKGGARRWWILTLKGEMNLPGIIAIRDKLMAQALHYYKLGIQWHLNSEEEAFFNQFIESHIVDDSRIQGLEVALEILRKKGEDANDGGIDKNGLSFLEIRSALDEHTSNHCSDRALSELLNQMGWRSKKLGRVFKRWFEGETAKAIREEKNKTIQNQKLAAIEIGNR